MADMSQMSARLRALLAGDGIVVAPGIYDHASLQLAIEAGFAAVFGSGYWASGATLGEPDVGIAGASEFLAIFGRFAAKSAVPVIADADTGFGSLASLDRAVKAYARAGIAAIQIEDQSFPKSCGHTGRAVPVSAEEMVARVKVAAEARGGDDIVIIARTDARLSEGLEPAIDRLAQYAEAGADVLFLESPKSEDEIAKAATALDLPLMINAAHGGVTPVLAPQNYAALGVKLVIYPSGAGLSAAAAARDFYRQLAGGKANAGCANMLPFGEMTRLFGMEEILALQDRHGRS